MPLDANLPTYPGNTPFSLEAIKRIARGDSSNVSTLHMSAHAGTHVDAPRHFFDDGAGAEALPLEMLMRPRRGSSKSRRAPAIAAEDLAGIDLSEDVRAADQDAQLAAVGHRRSSTPTTSASPSRARSTWSSTASRSLGVDYLSVEQFKTPGAPAHHVLLGAGTIVIEGLNLRDVEPGIYEMFCLPLRIVGSDGAPARVVLRRS